MIIVPEANNKFRVEAETEAELYLLRQFMLSWHQSSASISMHAVTEDGESMCLDITNRIPLVEVTEETLVDKIKRIWGAKN